MFSAQSKTPGNKVYSMNFPVFFVSHKIGVKFIIVSETTQPGVDLLLKKIYELYADYVLKNPFYSLEMPIRCELFDTNLQQVLEQMEKGGGITNI